MAHHRQGGHDRFREDHLFSGLHRAHPVLRPFPQLCQPPEALAFFFPAVPVCDGSLEKIIYLADYIEPTRNFCDLSELRELASRDLDGAMLLGLEMSIEGLKKRIMR